MAKLSDARMVTDEQHKIANCTTIGIVLAGMIVGASLLAHVATPFRLFGYPAFAMLCFNAAAAGGFWLVIRIVVADDRSRKKNPR
jgi:hypothetical protein